MNTLRPKFWLLLSILGWLLPLGIISSLVVTQDWQSLLRYGWLAVLVAQLTWMLFFNPKIIVDDATVTLVNVFRTVILPWHQINRVDTRFALTLFTQDAKFVAWAAPAPGRHAGYQAARGTLKNLPGSSYGVGGSIRPGDLPESDSGVAAYLVRQRWDKWQELASSGLAVESPRSQTKVTIHWRAAAIAAALAVASILGIFL